MQKVCELDMKKIFFLSVPFLLFLLLPFINLILVVPYTTLINALTKEETITAFGLSFFTAAICSILAFLLCTPFAYLLSSLKKKNEFLEILIDLPNVLPPIITGVLLLLLYGRMGFLGRYLSKIGFEIPFTTSAVVLAQLFVSMGYYLKVSYTSFLAVDKQLKEEGYILGLDELGLLFKVYLPVCKKGIVIGILGTFSRALGEFGATVVFAGNVYGKTQTVSLYIYKLYAQNQDEVYCVSFIMIAISYLLLYITKKLLNNVDY
ncbi:molybdate ABC transporter permease [Caldicellulosiruptor diazotrophicus]|uniref:Molybdate ABC transporter permease n=2 Tax=Caldicellulosiruptor diazotrophicus TaxID=2806205 RepID=A0ABN6EFI7_9FIRM|nr:molybdate ABC transporter permease [Caldicellulosiruptor diazotrophicus]